MSIIALAGDCIMNVGIFVAIFVGLLAGFLPLMMIMSGKWKALQEMARERNLADAKMNARLLRFDI